jgi:hypothetical protein
MLSIPEGCYLVVFMPCDTEEYMGYEPKAWVVKSFEIALHSIREFIDSGDFIPEIDCRFEIFDDQLNASGQQEVFEDMVSEAILSSDRTGLDAELDSIRNPSGTKDVGDLWDVEGTVAKWGPQNKVEIKEEKEAKASAEPEEVKEEVKEESLESKQEDLTIEDTR